MTEDNQDEQPVQLNRRKNLRNPIPVLRVKVDEDRRVFFGYARNISRTGLFITTLNPREVGERFPVEITFGEPINQITQAVCEVVWNRGYSKNSEHDPGMGLKFIELDDEVATAIEQWVHQGDDLIRRVDPDAV